MRGFFSTVVVRRIPVQRGEMRIFEHLLQKGHLRRLDHVRPEMFDELSDNGTMVEIGTKLLKVFSAKERNQIGMKTKKKAGLLEQIKGALVRRFLHFHKGRIFKRERERSSGGWKASRETFGRLSSTSFLLSLFIGVGRDCSLIVILRSHTFQWMTRHDRIFAVKRRYSSVPSDRPSILFTSRHQPWTTNIERHILSSLFSSSKLSARDLRVGRWLNLSVVSTRNEQKRFQLASKDLPGQREEIERRRRVDQREKNDKRAEEVLDQHMFGALRFVHRHFRVDLLHGDRQTKDRHTDHLDEQHSGQLSIFAMFTCRSDMTNG